MAGGFTSSGLDLQIADQLSFVGGMDYFLIMLIVVAVAIFSGELMSNTAGVALLLPIMASLAATMDVNPILLMAPVAIAMSYGFIMPVATPQCNSDWKWICHSQKYGKVWHSVKFNQHIFSVCCNGNTCSFGLGII